MALLLSFGYKRLPDTVTTAWGARLIITQDGMTDLLHDRQDTIGDKADVRRLLDLLNAGATKQALATLRNLLVYHELSTREDREVELYDDDTVRIVGSPQSSAGYFYMTGYLK